MISASRPGAAIATPHTSATEAGWQVLASGGTAVDAAIAAAAALTVCYPHMCAVGGDMFALVATADGTIHGINGSGAAAAATSAEDLRRRHDAMPTVGVDTITVPGLVAGWETLHRLGGRYPWGSLLDRAIELAHGGTTVSASLAASLCQQAALVSNDAGLSEIFGANGGLKGLGDPFRQPALARSLRRIAEDGPAALYDGSVGRELIRGLRARGSILDERDLQRHTSELTGPVARRFGEWEVFVNPPNSQGIALLQILGCVRELGASFGDLGRDAARLAWVFRAVARNRASWLADPMSGAAPDALLEADYLRGVLQATPPPENAPAKTSELRAPPARSSGDTVAIVTRDPSGQCVSLIQSVFHAFGSGILEPSTGILCHNRGAMFSLEPTSPNALAPVRRPGHTLMPVIVADAGGVVAVSGTMGGKAQPQIQAHILASLFTGDDDPREVVARPRWIVGGLDADSTEDHILVEPGVPDGVLEGLTQYGLPMVLSDHLEESAGHAQLIALRAGAWLAGTDPRADGAARHAS